MDWWTKIRLGESIEESSKRGILRREGISRETLKKISAHPEPPGYRPKEPRHKCFDLCFARPFYCQSPKKEL
jgi:hypothetical protein